MQQVIVTGGGEISYKVLSNYHFTAKQQYESRLSLKQPIETDYQFEVGITAKDIKEAKAIYMSYVNKLNGLGAALHVGHLNFLTFALKDFEGSFIITEAVSYMKLSKLVQTQIELMEYLETSNISKFIVKPKIKYSKSLRNITIEETHLVHVALNAIINQLHLDMKSEIEFLPIELKDLVLPITNPNLLDLKYVNESLFNFKPIREYGQLIYNICSTLRRYLNDWCPNLGDETISITNAHARIIYETLELHSLIKQDHSNEVYKSDYIRKIITNGTYSAVNIC
ncbi:hypothetical protein [Pedobacter mendelii]|uniref:Uncharacterized protein n=1 Tax=Pedobacter mendelii TaxID=1908240 RepID=A0ABQ2BLG0_9SPHI|nr:hypothetical protein [Pedobacter mendelii]GGI29050.1 hypothetical protein GCM10008119_35700 [Pedobacter mendelii]